ncbi:DUF1059 domain-containing protein [Aureibaculum luteum]|uniref:DUF1059 domain-containing protein n=1 Tax=Aureibaculum luteum TaxID=1548456 RepID=UPI000E4B8F17|nr:DUF1059 domain-containing protein [Aureibaculum luteum]
MKTMTCKQLGGACEKEFNANTFDEIGELSKVHAMEMFQRGDKPHLKAMNEMSELMKSPNAMNAWFNKKRKEFDTLQDEQ